MLGLGSCAPLAQADLIPALFAALSRFFVSYTFTPSGKVHVTVADLSGRAESSRDYGAAGGFRDLTARVPTLQQQVLSQSRLQPVVERLFPNKNAQEVGEMIDFIRINMTVELSTVYFL